MSTVTVLDGEGKRLSPCSEERARKLVASGGARLISESPWVIQLAEVISLPGARPAPRHALEGQRLLLHVCCAPCATFTARHLGDLGASVTGYWFNPSIHPYSEHEKRREALARYAIESNMAMLWEPGYDLVAYLRHVIGHEEMGTRCALCYRVRLEQTARVAAEQGYDRFSTTLLISPYQDLEIIRNTGQELAERYGVAFYFENLRRGFAEHHRMAREHDLYRQRYCGCLFSEWESLDSSAATRRRPTGERA